MYVPSGLINFVSSSCADAIAENVSNPAISSK
jgi:hypothetical protein